MTQRLFDSKGNELFFDASAGKINVVPSNAAGTNVDSDTGAADGVATTKVGQWANARGYLWNGTTWDRAPGNTSGAFIQGNVASGVADAGNPLKIGGVNRTTLPTLTDGQRGDAQSDTRGGIYVVPKGNNSTLGVDANTINSDGFAATKNGMWVAGMPMLFNGTTNDRQRGNVDGTTGDTGTKTTGTFNGATQTNYNARGAIITMLVGTVTGAITTFQTGIQWSYDGGTTWVGLTALGANDTAASSGKTYSWLIYPTNTSQAAGATPANLAPASGPTQLNVINAALPRTWRITMALTVATSLVITAVYVNYIL